MELGEKILFVGQAPSRTGDASKVLLGRTGLWLADLMGVSLAEYVERTDRVNLFDSWTGKKGKGDAWNATDAVRRAERLIPDLLGRTTIFLGRNVARAFGFPKLPWMTWVEAFGGRASVLPHPSGIVLWWNDAENRSAAGEFLRSSMETVRGGSMSC